MAEEAGFEVFLTSDKNIQFQQNLTGRKIGIVALSSPQWPIVRLHVDKVVLAVDAAGPCSYTLVTVFLLSMARAIRGSFHVKQSADVAVK
jgi:hypothetical protein